MYVNRQRSNLHCYKTQIAFSMTPQGRLPINVSANGHDETTNISEMTLNMET